MVPEPAAARDISIFLTRIHAGRVRARRELVGDGTSYETHALDHCYAPECVSIYVDEIFEEYEAILHTCETGRLCILDSFISALQLTREKTALRASVERVFPFKILEDALRTSMAHRAADKDMLLMQYSTPTDGLGVYPFNEATTLNSLINVAAHLYNGQRDRLLTCVFKGDTLGTYTTSVNEYLGKHSVTPPRRKWKSILSTPLWMACR